MMHAKHQQRTKGIPTRRGSCPLLHCIGRFSGADPGFWSGRPAEFWPQKGGGGLSPKFAQNKGCSPKIAWKLHDFEQILGAWAPLDPPVDSSCLQWVKALSITTRQEDVVCVQNILGRWGLVMVAFPEHCTYTLGITESNLHQLWSRCQTGSRLDPGYSLGAGFRLHSRTGVAHQHKADCTLSLWPPPIGRGKFIQHKFLIQMIYQRPRDYNNAKISPHCSTYLYILFSFKWIKRSILAICRNSNHTLRALGIVCFHLEHIISRFTNMDIMYNGVCFLEKLPISHRTLSNGNSISK